MSTASTGTPQYSNHLIHETSPYLLQHAHNPVNWYPWGDEALQRARKENKPIFLSIGYAACHWCHVMERESFEDEAIAAFLNEHFISIKVDREERPDLDEIYMTAVQLITGGGGWPMSVFLTSDLKPFYGGTYFPPTDMHGRPGFLTVLRNVAAAWEKKRDDLRASAETLTESIQQHMAAHEKTGDPITADLLVKAAADLQAGFDPADGGFGHAPKFPPSAALALLLRQYSVTHEKKLIDMVVLTLTKMAYGGMYDHLGGGFHRYSTDAHWLVPHFEKMLYDQALLAQVYLEAYQATQSPLFRRIAREILDYVLRDMTDPEGGFYSSEDADSEGQEGKFYLWTYREIVDAVGQEDARLFCACYDVREEGNFASHEPYHAGQNILHVPRSPGAVAAACGMSVEELAPRVREARAKLFALRGARVRPGRDDKVITAWNALMISALAQGCQVLEDGRYKAAAEKAASFVLTRMTHEGELLRTYRKGESRNPGFLDDYAFTVNALLDLYEADFDPRWVSMADIYAHKMIALFWDGAADTFCLTAKSHTNLIARSRPVFDGAEPSGNSLAALGLLRLARFVDYWAYEKKARGIFERNLAPMSRSPQTFLRMLCAVHYLLYAPKEIVIAGSLHSEGVALFLRALHSRYIPNKIVAVIDPADPDAVETGRRIPLLEGKRLQAGKPAAYICKDSRCGLPATTPEEFLKALDTKSGETAS